MTYARTSDEMPPLNKMGVILRNSKLLRDAGKAAASQWADFRSKKTNDVLTAYVTSLAEILGSTFFVAKALGMDLTGFRAAEAAVQELLGNVTKGTLSFKTLAPTNLGKVSLAMRDVLLSTRELVTDAQDMQGADLTMDETTMDETPMDLIIFGSDMSIVLSALVIVFKNLHGDIRAIVKARNETLRFFKVLGEEAMGAMPPEGSVEEGANIILATSLRKATCMLRKNPERGFHLLGSVERLILESRS
jgi:hypothetical protein